MASIEIVDTRGETRNYPQSFTAEETEALYDFVLLRDHATMIEVVDADESARGATVVRHDVDHSIDHALKLARYEASRGVSSTYFVLHTAWYFRDFEDAMAKCREIKSLGHEVGIHMDACTAAKILGGSGEPGEMARYILASVLTRMAGSEVAVRGSACHGSDLGCDNLAFWKTYSLSQFGLAYEAYHVHGEYHANYISDNHGRLRAPLEHVDGRPTHLLIHPEHWCLNGLGV